MSAIKMLLNEYYLLAYKCRTGPWLVNATAPSASDNVCLLSGGIPDNDSVQMLPTCLNEKILAFVWTTCQLRLSLFWYGNWS